MRRKPCATVYGMVMWWFAENDPKHLKKRGTLKRMRRVGNGVSVTLDSDCDKRKARIKREAARRAKVCK